MMTRHPRIVSFVYPRRQRYDDVVLPRSTSPHSACSSFLVCRRCVTRYVTIGNPSHMDTHSTVSLSSATWNFLHAIQGRTSFEPSDLLLVHRVIQTNCVYLAVFMFNLRLHRLKERTDQMEEKKSRVSSPFCLTYFRFPNKMYFTNLARCQILQSEKTDLVVRLNFIVISRIGEGQRQETLLLQIRLVYTSETLDNDGTAAKMARFQGSVFPGGTFTVILITHRDPLYALLFVIARNVRHGTPFIRQLVLNFIHLAIFRIDGAKKTIINEKCDWRNITALLIILYG